MSLRTKPTAPSLGCRVALVVLLGLTVAFGVSSGAVSIGNTPSGGGFTWGVGVGGGTCSDVIDAMRSNWFDVRAIVSPKTKAMRPRSRDFYCVSPAYIEHARPKVVPMTTGLKCFELQDRGFCCDSQHQRCATM